MDSLNTFNSTNVSQGSAKWIGLDLETNTNDITQLTWNGSSLTADDVAEAASVGLGAGHIVFWGRADSLALAPRAIRIGGAGLEEVTIKVSFTEA